MAAVMTISIIPAQVVTHAELRNSGQTGGAEFGVMASKGIPNDETQVREIRMCKTSDYE